MRSTWTRLAGAGRWGSLAIQRRVGGPPLDGSKDDCAGRQLGPSADQSRSCHVWATTGGSPASPGRTNRASRRFPPGRYLPLVRWMTRSRSTGPLSPLGGVKDSDPRPVLQRWGTRASTPGRRSRSRVRVRLRAERGRGGPSGSATGSFRPHPIASACTGCRRCSTSCQATAASTDHRRPEPPAGPDPGGQGTGGGRQCRSPGRGLPLREPRAGPLAWLGPIVSAAQLCGSHVNAGILGADDEIASAVGGLGGEVPADAAGGAGDVTTAGRAGVDPVSRVPFRSGSNPLGFDRWPAAEL